MASKKFGLVFNSIPEKCVEQMKTAHVYFVDDPKRGWVSKDGAPTNILIEGENYQALRALEYTHAGKVDCIYIDPPYNTGNKDFVYNDVFVDDEDAYRHSKWLSFMQHRLEIAHRLLSDRGVIFLSIDDNEFAQLKLLCDKVFGEENVLPTIVWKKKSGGDNNAKFIAGEHEYILVYAKNIGECKFNRVPQDVKEDTSYKYEDKWVNERGSYKIRQLDDPSVQGERPNLKYSIVCPDGSKVQGERWRWSQDKVKWGIEQDRIEFKQVKGAWKVYLKQYQFEDNDGNKIERSTIFRSVVDDVLGAEGTRELADIMGGKVFDYPKSVKLIKKLLYIGGQKDAVILDFFAGTGTTGQAVAELNKEDGGNRQFILITNNDKSDRLPNGIARDCTYPRLQKTIKDTTNLRYLRVETLDHSRKHKSDSAKIAQLATNNRMMAILNLQHNCHNAIEKNDRFTIFSNPNGTFFLGVYFNDQEKYSVISNKDLKVIRSTLKGYGKNVLMVNTPNGYASEYFKFFQTGNI